MSIVSLKYLVNSNFIDKKKMLIYFLKTTGKFVFRHNLISRDLCDVFKIMPLLFNSIFIVDR